jgi:hypothetical protein
LHWTIEIFAIFSVAAYARIYWLAAIFTGQKAQKKSATADGYLTA